MVISDARGNILKANRRFRKLQDLRRKEGQKNSPSSPALSRLARGEIRELSLGGSPGGPGNGDGSRGEEFKFRGRLIGKYPQGKKNNQASWLLFMAEGPEAEEGGEKPLPEGGAGSQRVLEIKSRFLANVSHEIRTPIQTIIGMIELLEDTRLDREQKEYAGQIKFSAEALLCLVRDLLDYSKIEAGKMEREYIDFDLERTIEQAADMVSLEAHKKGLELVLDIPSEAAVTARGDPHKFTRILINLLKNAVKFTREGSVTVAVRLLNCGDGEKLKVTVADTGIGVPPEARGRLFTPFMQADPSTARCFGGTGLGLAISAGLAGLLGGSIGMIPNEGGGSIFSFTLPLEGSPGVPPSKAVPCRETRVLLVDDRPEARHIIVSYLRDIGYMDIETADSGEIALTILGAAASRNRPFELCLVDMIMPGMDGWQLAAEIRRSELLRGTALILMVPQGLLGGYAKTSLRKCFRAYLNKPVKRRILADTLNTALINPAKEGFLPGFPPSEPLRPEPALFRKEAAGHPPLAGGEGADKVPVMIVEDDPVNQQLFALILHKLGYRVIFADNGLEALEKAAGQGISFVFMDIQMPRLNGYETARILRERKFTGPIVAITASAFQDEQERCKKAGFNDILIKPFKRADIAEMLCKWAPAIREISPVAAEVPGVLSSGAPEPVPQREVFSEEEVLDAFMDKRDILKPLLAHFLDQTGKRLGNLPEILTREDWETARRNIHTIRGGALTLSGKELGKAAARLEGAVKRGDKQEMNAALPFLSEAFKRFKAETALFLKEP